MNVPSPNGQGWSLKNGKIMIDWMSQAVAPKELHALISCSCGLACDSKRCSCKKNGILCNTACKCGHERCQNKLDDTNTDEEDEESENGD